MPTFNARALAIYFSALFALCAVARAAVADEAEPDALALYRLATADDAALRFATALHEYEASLTKDPSHRFALRARARADTLRSHAEGDFVPFTTLERFRRDPGAGREPAELTRLAAEADGFPPGLVRVEARVTAADSWLDLGDEAKALPLLENVVRDPNADPVTLHAASRELVGAYLAQGDGDRALAIAALPRQEPDLARTIALAARRRALRSAALALLALFALASVTAIARALTRGEGRAVGAATRRFAPLAFGFALWTAVAGGVLASSYEAGRAAPFIGLAAVTFVVVLFARALGAAQSSSPRSVRVSGALLSAGAVVSAAFLLLASLHGGAYLTGLGL